MVITMSIINNTQRHELTLNKKLNSICNHIIRELVAIYESVSIHMPILLNPVDFYTNDVPGGILEIRLG